MIKEGRVRGVIGKRRRGLDNENEYDDEYDEEYGDEE
jgi:hypothetical protein